MEDSEISSHSTHAQKICDKATKKIQWEGTFSLVNSFGKTEFPMFKNKTRSSYHTKGNSSRLNLSLELQSPE